MSERALAPMCAEDFLEWGLSQTLRYELIDGVPVAMAGAKQRHDRVVANVHGMLYNQLRANACRNFTADIAVRIPAGNVRRPDAGIDCGDLDDNETAASAPFLVLEVLSPSTRDFDLIGKLEEYKTVPGLAHIVVVETDILMVHHWSRPSGGVWSHVLLEQLDAAVRVPEIGVTLELGRLYEGLIFRVQPRLIYEGDAPSASG